MILLEMINIVFLFLAEVLEVAAVILSLPAKIVGDISSFCYGASHALDAYENKESNEDEDGGE